MVHAIGVTLIRLAITRRRLLEWETAESVARRERPSRSLFFSQMVASPAVALGALLLVLHQTAVRVGRRAALRRAVDDGADHRVLAEPADRAPPAAA